MNRIFIKMIIFALAFVSTNALAQTITIGTGSGVAGETVVIPINFASGAQPIGNFTIDVAFDAAQFSSALGDCSVANVNQEQSSCTEAAGLIRVSMIRGSGELTTGLAANLDMTIAGDASPGTVALTGTMQAIGYDGTDLALDAIAVTDGSIDVLGAAYDSTNPAPGAVVPLSAKQSDSAAQDMMVSNVGVAGTTLMVTCSEVEDLGDVFTISPDTEFSVAQGASAPVNISCDTSVLGDFVGSMSCAHNGDGTGAASPVVYPLTCNVLDADPAIYEDDPDAGSTIDMTMGMDVKTGDSAPTSVLMISNTAVAGAHPLNLDCSNSGAEITADVTGPFSVSAGNSTSVTFTCPTDTANSFTTDYSCLYTDDGTTPGGDNGTSVMWTYTCDVRGAQATVEPTPPDGTTLTELAQPGGSVDFNVIFSEVGGEDVAGSLVSCSLGTGTAFEITDPLLFPQVISAGGSETVTVTGTDPGGVDSATDTLTCTYTDGADESTTVTYTLVMDIGGNATFVVNKVFTDDSMDDIDVTITCDTGLPLTQTHTINAADGVGFVVKSFESGEMNCSITEDLQAGYIPSYEATGDSLNADDEPDNPGCHFFNVDGGDGNVCNITNTPAPVAVAVTKEWIAAGAGDELDFGAEIIVRSLNPIEDDLGEPGFDCLELEGNLGSPSGDVEIEYCLVLEFLGPSTQTRTVWVIPDWSGTVVKLKEDLDDNSMESTNNCGGENAMVMVKPGQGSSCTFVNTVFFEGIPTLNQYGLAILALLMLGVGMVGFRRFA